MVLDWIKINTIVFPKDTYISENIFSDRILLYGNLL